MMPTPLPPEVMQQNANGEAPNNALGQQAQPNKLAKGREQPGQKGKKTAAQKMYPKLATQEGGGNG